MAEIRIDLQAKELDFRVRTGIRFENLKQEGGFITGDIVWEIAGQSGRIPFRVPDNFETQIPFPLPNVQLWIKVRVKSTNPLTICASARVEISLPWPFPPVKHEFPEVCAP